MKIAIGCDHAAFKEKNKIKQLLESLNYKVVDCGTHSSDSVDYPLYGHAVASEVSNNKVDKGIVICGSGIGISIAANKIKGIRAALCTSIEHAEMSIKHNNANILSLGARFMSKEEIYKMIEIWFEEPFEGGRHERRIENLDQ